MTMNLSHDERFSDRHIGPSQHEIDQMLEFLGVSTIEEFIDQVVPESIRTKQGANFATPPTEERALSLVRDIACKNKVYRSLIGLGYYDTLTPTVIQRNVLENPGWCTQYTPYQAEIAQGRL